MVEDRREFVSVESATGSRAGAGGRPCQGVYHRPSGREPAVAIIATHYNVDFSEHYLAPYLAERGYGFLGWNTRYRGNEAYFLLEHALIDIGAGVSWLRHRGVETVVLLGNSGGGSLMAAYQSQAVEPNIRPGHGRSLPDAALGLPPADLYVSLNAHPGRPDVLTAWLDPAVATETDPLSVVPELDMFLPEHGPPYSPEFVSRYRAAQRARNERISTWCLDELGRLEAAGVRDRTFELYRVWADLRFADLSLDPSDRSPGCYLGDPKRANYGPSGIGRCNTLRTWLSMWSLDHSDCQAAPHLARISVPSLVVQTRADQGVFPSDGRALHEALAADDKTLEEFVPGDHYLLAPADARNKVADLVAGWIGERAS
jgi:pimeloyl-ACP methyl ester carboxylesterase